MRWPWLALLLLPALTAASAVARPDADPWLDLSDATFLASPGLPAALMAYLPDGAAPRPLTWPLPPGPLVVLALPDQDPTARELVLALGLGEHGPEQAGGWRRLAWMDRERPIVLLLAADPVALLGARHEIESWIPAGSGSARESELRSETPAARVGLRVPLGERSHRPAFARRALRTSAELSAADVAELAAVGVQQVWIHAHAPTPPAAVRAALRHYGLVLGVVIEADEDLSERAGVASSAWTRTLATVLRPWQERLEVRHFALDVPGLTGPPPPQPAAHASAGAHEAPPADAPTWPALARSLADALRPQGLQEFVVLAPVVPGARLPVRPWRDIPELVLASAGVQEHPDAVEAADLDAARRHLGAQRRPLLYRETWHAPAWSALRAPSLPRRREPALAKACEGLWVDGGRDAIATLARGWDTSSDCEPRALEPLSALLPLTIQDARDFAQELGWRLQTRTPPPEDWLKLCAKELTALADTHGDVVLAVPRVPAGAILDGRLDEATWAHAARLPLDEQRSWRVLSDGERLILGLPGGCAAGVPWSVGLGDGPVVAGPVQPDARLATPWARVAHGRDLEVALTRLAQQGDAHLGRVLPLRLKVQDTHSLVWVVVVP